MESNIFWQGPDFGYPANYSVVDYRFKESLNYLDVPIMFEKNFGGGGASGVATSASTGPSAGVNGVRGIEHAATQIRHARPAARRTADDRR